MNLQAMTLLLNRHYGPSAAEMVDLTFDQWVSVLKLTTMWRFTRLRRATIDKMTPMLDSVDPIRRITLARVYDVAQWLLPGLHALARRTEPLKMNEVEPLGLQTFGRMAQVRESFVAVQGRAGMYGLSSRSTHDFEAVIRRVFSDELKNTTYGHQW